MLGRTKLGPTGPDETWLPGDLYQTSPMTAVQLDEEQAQTLNMQLQHVRDKAEAAELLRQEFALMRSCPKCGFEPKTFAEAPELLYSPEKDSCAMSHGLAEHLDRRCRVCHYTWAESLPHGPTWQNDGSLTFTETLHVCQPD